MECAPINTKPENSTERPVYSDPCSILEFYGYLDYVRLMVQYRNAFHYYLHYEAFVSIASFRFVPGNIRETSFPQQNWRLVLRLTSCWSPKLLKEARCTILSTLLHIKSYSILWCFNLLPRWVPKLYKYVQLRMNRRVIIVLLSLTIFFLLWFVFFFC